MSETLYDHLTAVFFPNRIAVVGASANPAKLGHQALLALTRGGFKGDIYAVNPSAAGREILGVRCFGAIDQLPGGIQLFVFALPHPLIEPSLKMAAAKGARGAVVFAGGFRETGPDGAALQQRIRLTADACGIKIIGPNCVGMINLHHGLNATFAYPDLDMPAGRVAVVSQSGGTGLAILNLMLDNCVGLSKFVSVGNRVNLDFADLLVYLADDPETDVICLFIEGIDEGRRFFEAACRAARKKAIIACQAGASGKSRELAGSHTGSMTESRAVIRAALWQAGVLPVDHLEEMIDTAKALCLVPSPRGNGIAVFTHTAGPAIIVTEIIEAGGAVVPDFSPAHKKELLPLLPEFARPTLPLDMFAHGWLDPSLYLKSLKMAFSQPDVHMACACFIPDLENRWRFPAREYAEIARTYGKPAILALMTPQSHIRFIAEADAAGVPSYISPEKAARTLVNLIRCGRLKRRPPVAASTALE